MRVYACKDTSGAMRVLRSSGEPVNPHCFMGNGLSRYVLQEGDAEPICSTLAPGTFRELKKLDVVSGEYEFVEEVKVPTLLEAAKNLINTNLYGMNEVQYAALTELHKAVHREASKPAPRYDEALIDELLEIGLDVCLDLGSLLRLNPDWDNNQNRRAAEILQSLKRAKGEG